MWIYDGEDWSQDEDGERSRTKSETPRPRYDEAMPELQVIEIVPLPTKRRVPPGTHPMSA